MTLAYSLGRQATDQLARSKHVKNRLPDTAVSAGLNPVCLPSFWRDRCLQTADPRADQL
jgi:hypothetical protein